MSNASEQGESQVKSMSRQGQLRSAALKSSVLPLTTIREKNRQILRDIIDQTVLPKIVFFDKTVIRPLGTLVDGAELKQWGIHTSIELDEPTVDLTKLLVKSDGTPHSTAPRLDRLALIFILRPNATKAALAAKQIKYEEKLHPKQRLYILAVLPRATEEFMAIFLQELGEKMEYLFSAEQIRVHSCPIYLFPFDSDLISLELYDVVRNFHSQGDPSDLILCSEAFIQLQTFLQGLCPNLKVVGNAAKFVCDQIIRVRRELQMQLPFPSCFSPPQPSSNSAEQHKSFFNLFDDITHPVEENRNRCEDSLHFVTLLRFKDETSSDESDTPSCMTLNLPKECYPETKLFSNKKALRSCGLDVYSRYHRRLDDVIFMDRRVDYLTPLCTPFTYEALLDEIIGIQQTFLCVGGASGLSSSSKLPNQTKFSAITKTILISSDPVFADIRHLPQHFVGSILHQKASEVQKTYKEKESLTSIAEINEFMKKFKIKQSEHISISNHVNLLSTINSVLKTYEFQHILQLENDIMNLPNLSNAAILEIVSSIIDLCDNEPSPHKSYRLLCLLSIVNDGLKPQWIEEISVCLCRTFGIQELTRLHFMEKAGFFKVKTQSMDNRGHWNEIKNKLQLIVEDTTLCTSKITNLSQLNDISYVCSGYAPLSVRLIELLYKNPPGWKKLSSIFNLLWGPTLEIQQTCLFSQEENQSTQTEKHETHSSPGESSDESQISIIFFLGGCTYAELTALRYLNQSKHFKNQRQFIVMTTEMLNYQGLINSFSLI